MIIRPFLTSSPTHLDYSLIFYPIVNKCSSPQNHLIMVLLHLIKPLMHFNENEVKKKLSTQEVREICMPDTVQHETRQKTIWVIMTTGTLLSKAPRPSFDSKNKPTPWVSSLVWAWLTQAPFPLRVPGLYQHYPPCTLTWETSSAHFPAPPPLLFHFHLKAILSPGLNWSFSTREGVLLHKLRAGWQSALSLTEAWPSLRLGCWTRPKASTLSEAEANQGTWLHGKKGALTLLKTAVDLLVLKQLLAVVPKRLPSRVRHDEKPSLIGDAGNGHGRPGGGRGGARDETRPGGVGSPMNPPLPVGPAFLLHFHLYVSVHLERRHTLKEDYTHTVSGRPRWVKQDSVISVFPLEASVLSHCCPGSIKGSVINWDGS